MTRQEVEAIALGLPAATRVVQWGGADVYKVKRAVRFSFMDFSTLEKRRRACLREIELNRETAPALSRAPDPARSSTWPS